MADERGVAAIAVHVASLLSGHLIGRRTELTQVNADGLAQ
jgi:hypothetical protein